MTDTTHCHCIVSASLDTRVETYSYKEKRRGKESLRTGRKKRKWLVFGSQQRCDLCPLQTWLRLRLFCYREVLHLLFLGGTSSALLGMLIVVCPNTSRLLPNHCWHHLYPNLPLCSLHKGCASTTWLLQAVFSSEATSPAKTPLSPWHEQELETSTLTPKIVCCQEEVGRTCAYWQFINKQQLPCKLFTKECSEVWI